MSALFSKPKTPKVSTPSPLPPPPERSDEETAALAEEQRKKYSGSGRAMTMLTGGTGAAAGVTAGRFLGSAAST